VVIIDDVGLVKLHTIAPIVKLVLKTKDAAKRDLTENERKEGITTTITATLDLHNNPNKTKKLCFKYWMSE